MKMRLLCVMAALFAFAAAAQAAEAGKTDDASSGGAKKLIIPSMEMGGGSLGVSTDRPGDPSVPTFNDPDKQDKPIEPFVGLKFTKPLGGK